MLVRTRRSVDRGLAMVVVELEADKEGLCLRWKISEWPLASTALMLKEENFTDKSGAHGIAPGWGFLACIELVCSQSG